MRCRRILDDVPLQTKQTFATFRMNERLAERSVSEWQHRYS